MEKYVLVTHVDLDGSACEILGRKYLQVDWRLCFTVDNCEVGNLMKKIFELEELPYCNLSEYTIVFADIAPPEQYCKTLSEKFKKVIVCDHHITNDYISDYFPDQKIVSYNPSLKRKECGASLLWKWLKENVIGESEYVNEEVDYFVELTRLYDTWEWKNSSIGKEALDLNTLHSLVGNINFVKVMYHRLFIAEESVFTIDDHMYINAANSKEEKRFKDASTKDDNHCEVIHDLMCYIKIIGPEGVSKYADWFLSTHKEYDVYIGINPKDGTVSFRTQRDDVNVAKMFAKPLGGGGHAKAAGATLKEEFAFLYRKYLIDSFDKIVYLLQNKQ